MSNSSFPIATKLFDDLSEEIWFGVNFRIVLATASVSERDNLRTLINRAREVRGLDPIKTEG